MNSTTSLFHKLKTDFWETLARLQDQRGVWLLLAGTALALELVSWGFFQKTLNLKPCEMCVYIRFAMLAICFGALVAAIRPRSTVFKLTGYALTLWWTVKGFLWCMHLHRENVMAADPDWISPCGMTATEFPFGIRLDLWLPSHFRPLAACGYDSGWSLLGLTMPQWLFIVYACFALALGLMLAAWILRGVRSQGRR